MDPYDFLPELGCALEAMTVHPRTNTVIVGVPEGECTDMAGIIDYVLARFPFVQEIRTFAGGRLDTVYMLRSGRWFAGVPREGDEQERLDAPMEAGLRLHATVYALVQHLQALGAALDDGVHVGDVLGELDGALREYEQVIWPDGGPPVPQVQ